MEGYFKVHRKILDSQVFAHQTALKIWIWCLAKVTFKDRFISLKSGKGCITVALKPGQFIFGRFKAEEELNIDGSTIYKWMQKFASDEFDMIKIESSNQYSIITICKWEEYQNGYGDEVTTNEQPSNSQVTAKEQPSNTNKNDNKDKNDNNKKGGLIFDFVSSEFKEPFESWIKYKKSRKEMYKSQESLEACYKNLLKLSGNDPEIANEVVNNSLANNWAGLFKVKDNYKSKNKEDEITDDIVEKVNAGIQF